MKQYKKVYENFFSADRPNLNVRLKIEKVSADGIELEEYTSLFRNFLDDFYRNLFLNCVKLSWLRRKFKYHDRKTVFPIRRNSWQHVIGFTKFLRRYIGKDIQIVSRSNFYSKLESYFDELFPGFMEGNPFENPDQYEFPFKNISMEFLLPLAGAREIRMDLLKFADEQNMSYAVFLDYIINHVLSINEEIGRDRYTIEFRRNKSSFPWVVKDNDVS